MEVSVRSVDVDKKQCIFVEGTDILLVYVRDQLLKDGLVLPDCFAFITNNDNQITRQQEERITLGTICGEEDGIKVIYVRPVTPNERSSQPTVNDKRPTEPETDDIGKPQVPIQTQDVLIINQYDGRTLVIKVKPKDKIENVKKKISEKSGITTDRQELYCNGMPLEDQTDVKVLKPGMIVNLVEKIDVILQTLSKETFTVRNLTPTDLVKKLKIFFDMHKGIPEDSIRLIFRNKDEHALANERTLSSYGIKHNSTVFVVQRLKGS